MIRRLLTITRLDGYRPISVGSHHAYDSWDQIHRFLELKLGRVHADLFAEPGVGGGEVVWYATTEADPIPCAQATPDMQAAATQRLGALVADINRLADELDRSRDPSDRRWAAMLRAVLQLPGSLDLVTVLHLTGDQPVLTMWGTRDDLVSTTADTVQDKLRQRSPPPLAKPATADPPALPPELPEAAPPVEPVAPVPVSGGLPWLAMLLWGLFAVLVGLIYWQLLDACAVSGPFGRLVDYCPATRAEAPADRMADLRAQLADLQGQAAQAPQCRLEPRFADGTPVRPSAPPPQDQTAIDRQRAEAGGREGDVTVTLVWRDRTDLDLSVRCAGGETVDFRKMQACGGEFEGDLDANKCTSGRFAPRGIDGRECLGYSERPVTNPVENIFFSRSKMPRGRFEVLVTHFAAHSDSLGKKIPFEVQVRMRSTNPDKPDDVRTYSMTAAPGATVRVTGFDIR